MAISFVDANSAIANSVAIPTHETGDLLMVVARRASSATPPSLPDGSWTTIQEGATGSSVSVRVGYKFAAAPGELSGTWTNASVVGVGVWRGVDSIGDSAKIESNSVLQFPALTLTVTDGSSWVACFNGRQTATGVEPSDAANLLLREECTAATPRGAILDSNGGVASWAAANCDTGGTTWVNVSVELVAAVEGGAFLSTPIAVHIS